jgi:hypothetical protein
VISDIEDLSVDYEEDGQLVVKQLDKKILSKGAWSTIIFQYQEWNAKEEKYGPAKFTIRRYQKRHDQYNQKSKFNISSVDQAQKIIEALNAWIAADESVA